MDATNGKFTILMLGTSRFSAGKMLSGLINHFRQAKVIGFSAMTLLVLAFPARAAQISFTTVPAVTHSTNITGPGTTPLVFGAGTWQTMNDGIGCVVFPGTSPGNVCGSAPIPGVTSGRFDGSAFRSDPGAVPDGGNYVLIDGSPLIGNNTNTTVLFYSLSGLTVNQAYAVDFWQAAAQFVAGSSGAPTTEQWLVSFDTDYTNCNPMVTGGPSVCESQFAPGMSTPGSGDLLHHPDAQPWGEVQMTFVAKSATELLGFFAQGTPGGEPPIDLLGDVSVNAAPEPGTCVMLGVGLLGVGIARRRHNKRAES